MTGTVADLLTLPFDPGTTADAAAPGRESAQVQQWLDRAHTGEEAAFGCLVEAHQRVAIRTAMAALGRQEDAEDVAQEAFLLAWRKLAGFRGESSFRTWLLTIVWRKALDRRRSRLRWWKLAAPQADDAPFDTVAVSAASPEHLTVARDAVARTRREIARLSPTLRDTLLLAASGEHTYEQIAQMLNAPIGTIKWRVAEARRRVSERLNS